MQYKKDAFFVTQTQILNAVEIYIITNLSREWYDAFFVTRVNKYSQRTKAYYKQLRTPINIV